MSVCGSQRRREPDAEWYARSAQCPQRLMPIQLTRKLRRCTSMDGSELTGSSSRTSFQYHWPTASAALAADPPACQLQARDHTVIVSRAWSWHAGGLAASAADAVGQWYWNDVRLKLSYRWVLDMLKTVELALRGAVEQTVTVVGCDNVACTSNTQWEQQGPNTEPWGTPDSQGTVTTSHQQPHTVIVFTRMCAQWRKPMCPLQCLAQFSAIRSSFTETIIRPNYYKKCWTFQTQSFC